MKKGIFFLLLALVIAGCASSTILNIPQQYTLNAKTQNSVVLGKVTFTGIEPGFGEFIFIIQDTETEKDYFIKMPPPKTQDNAKAGPANTDYYYFVELPPGHYNIRQLAAIHKKFEVIETYLLHANFTIPQSSIIYIGSIKIKNIKSSLSLLAPLTENEILDERKDVIKNFQEHYPQFKDHKIEVKLIDEYEFFKEGGIGGKF